jgi:hypothetical protein
VWRFGIVKSKTSLRDDMPTTAGFVDRMREAFGVEMINAAIKGGLSGDGSFYANENGFEIGSRPAGGQAVNGLDLAPSFAKKGKK